MIFKAFPKEMMLIRIHIYIYIARCYNYNTEVRSSTFYKQRTNKNYILIRVRFQISTILRSS